MFGVGCEVDREIGEVTKKGSIATTEDAAILFAEVKGISRSCPLPLDRDGEIVCGECLLNHAGAKAVEVCVEVLGRLGDDGCGFEVWGKGFPKKDVAVDVKEGTVLQAVGNELADGPPVHTYVFETIEFGGDLGEGETKLVDEEALARSVGDENRLRIMSTRSLEGEPPGQHVLQRMAPTGDFIRMEGLAPE